MDKISNMNDIRNPIIIINDSLDKYSGKIHFPKKYALVNEFLARAGMPKEYYEERYRLTFKEDELTPLQVQLLHCYAFTPSEEQMVKLKGFLKELFPNKIEESNVVINNDIDTKIHFPEKVAQAKKIIARAGLPKEYYEEQNRKPLTFREDELTPLQVELLRSYAFTPSEEQMVKLKAFLKELFPDKIEELQSA